MFTKATVRHPTAPLVFISYSHADRRWADLLLEQMGPLQRGALLDCWSDSEIRPGDVWRTEIQRALDSAVVAVLLVTPAFLNSDFIAQNELPPLLRAAERRNLTVVWIPITASVYAHTPIVEYQAAHDPNRPLDSLTRAKRSQALVQIADRIVTAVKTAQRLDAPPLVSTPAQQDLNDSAYASPESAAAIRPTLMIVYRAEGWYLQNTGRGPALNTIVAQRIVNGPERGTWINPVRVQTLAPGHELLLKWLDHENETGLGATYEDEDGRVLTSITGNDLTKVVRRREIPTFDEQVIRRDWQVPIGSVQRIGGDPLLASHYVAGTLQEEISKRIERVDFLPARTYDGYVMNYVYSFARQNTDLSNPHHGHQGAPDTVVPQNEALLLAELNRRDSDSVYAQVMADVPPGYVLDWISLRIIFDHKGVFKLLQHCDGNVIGPDGESRPLRRMVKKST